MPSIPRDTVIQGEGIVLRLADDEDVPAIVAALQDPAIPRWTRVPENSTIETVQGFLESGRAQADEGEALHMTVYDAEDGRVVASCGLVGIDWVDLWGEVGYWVAAPERGRGLAARATRAVCRYAFDELGLQRMQLQAAADNAASNAVARRVGFTLEGTLRSALIEGHTGEPGDPREDANIWGLLPHELTG